MLFNWLQPIIPGARCLDVFAGSGALGLEALSRGAAQCVFVDQQRGVIDAIRAHLQLLEVTPVELVQANALEYLQQRTLAPFDIVFVDPPFHQGLAAACCQRLQQYALVKPGARVYIEVEQGLADPGLPPDWQILRDKRTGQVRSLLAQTA